MTIMGSPHRDRIRIFILITLAGNAATILINGHRRDAHFPNIGEPLPKEIRVEAGKGDDVITLQNYMGYPVDVYAGPGNDVIQGVAVGGRIFAGSGNDVVSINTSGDPGVTVFGGDGNDRVIVTSEAHHELHGGNGNDTLIGDKGDDRLFGDAGNDALKGGDGIDTYSGGDGNDRFYSGDANGDELVDGGKGFDRVFYPDDCSLPRDNLVSIFQNQIHVIGTDHVLFCTI